MHALLTVLRPVLCTAGVGVSDTCPECWRCQMVNAQATYRWHRLSSDTCPSSPLLERAGHTVTAVGKDIYVIAGKGYILQYSVRIDNVCRTACQTSLIVP